MTDSWRGVEKWRSYEPMFVTDNVEDVVRLMGGKEGTERLNTR